jgi:hypothetical protein
MSVTFPQPPARVLVERAAEVPPAGYRRQVRAVPAGTWSAEAVLQALREWAGENGRAPRAEDWSAPSQASPRIATTRRRVAAAPRWPCPTTVRRYFGSWSAGLEQAGLRPGRLAPWELNLSERVATARRLAANGLRASEIAQCLGVSVSTVRKYRQARVCPGCHGPLVTPSARNCHDCDARLRSSFWTAAEVFRAERDSSEDRATIIAALRHLALVDGRRPSWSDLHPKRPGLPSYGKTVSLFGSFGAALEAAGFQPRGRVWTRAEIISALREWSQLHGRPPVCKDWQCTTDEHPGSRAVGSLFGSWSAALTAAGLRPDWPREQMVRALRRWADEHGRAPTSRDWQSPDLAGRRSTTERVRREFETWSAALAAADLQASRGCSTKHAQMSRRPRHGSTRVGMTTASEVRSGV